MSTVADRLRVHRREWLTSFDVMAWAAALALAAVSRMEFHVHLVPWLGVLAAWGCVAVLHLLIGATVGLHSGRYRLASLEEMISLGIVTAGSGALLFVANLWFQPSLGVPRSVPLSGTFLALAAMAWGRACWRRLDEATRVTRAGEHSQPVVVFGAGNAGEQLLRSMRRDPSARYRPVALIDDDPLKRSLRIHGVPVLGTSSDVAEVAARSEASVFVVAIPSVDAAVIRDVSHEAMQAGLEVKVLPGLNELLEGRVDVSDIRDINVADLLGRHQIETDLASIAGYLSGQRVLVTGAGGSIGSELCRQVQKWGPAELIMLDHDESALHAVQLSVYGRALLDSPDVVLADIRDTHFITGLFETRRPDVVFHAAALKHLPMLEQYPGEGLKTNVWGTLTILEAAKASGVKRFVNISTDKAANPESVLGYTKRIAEGLTAAISTEAEGSYLSVRFGNVLGSRGSVLTAFTAQIAAGGPVTVTHPDVTRYFMTVQEAVQLVIQAAAIGHDGEALVLDMGEPVRIDDVARQLIEFSGRREIEIQYTGLREGEKMHEVLFGEGEPDIRPAHPLVSHVSVPPMHPVIARGLDPWATPDIVAKSLRDSCESLGDRVAGGLPKWS